MQRDAQQFPEAAIFLGEGRGWLPRCLAALSQVFMLFRLNRLAFAARAFLIAAAVLALSALAVSAQEAENRKLDTIKADLTQIEQELGTGNFDDAALTAILTRIERERANLAEVTGPLSPRAKAIQTRLDQLGPAPAEGQPPESPELAQERQAQLDAQAPIAEVLKRASSLNVQANQLQDVVGEKRRALFASRFLARTRSLVDPVLWIAVVNEAPRRLTVASRLMTQWGGLFAERMGDRRGAFLIGALALAFVVVWPLRKWVQRLGRMYFAEATPATRVRRSAGAAWVLLVTTAAPVLAVYILYAGLVWQGFVPERAIPFVGSLVWLTGFVAFVAGLSRAILSPAWPSWRLPALADESAARLAPYPILIAMIAAVAHALLAFYDVIGIGLAPVMVTHGVAAIAIAIAFALALRPIRAVAEAGSDASTREESWIYGLVRLCAWGAIAVIFAAALVGYIAFAFFLANQMVWIAVLGAVLYLLLVVVDDMICGWWPASRIGRLTHDTVGLRQSSMEQIAVLTSGVLRLALVVIAALLVVAPWGVQSGDVLGWVRRAFGGVSIPGFSLSLETVFGALTILILGIALTRIVQSWLDQSYLPRTRLDDGIKNSVRTATGYAGVLLAIGLAFSTLGFGLDRIALVAGALSVGIGFGLQAVVSNFVSGLILLAERPIKVGDWVSVGDNEGDVRRISVRSTVIELFDHSTLIVPNSDLITKPVRNWTLRRPLGRVVLAIGTSHTADVEQVRSILLEAAAGVPALMKNPPPQLLIVATTDTGVQWTLSGNVPSPRHVDPARSELYFAVLKEFQAKKIAVTAAPAI